MYAADVADFMYAFVDFVELYQERKPMFQVEALGARISGPRAARDLAFNFNLFCDIIEENSNDDHLKLFYASVNCFTIKFRNAQVIFNMRQSLDKRRISKLLDTTVRNMLVDAFFDWDCNVMLGFRVSFVDFYVDILHFNNAPDVSLYQAIMDCTTIRLRVFNQPLLNDLLLMYVIYNLKSSFSKEYEDLKQWFKIKNTKNPKQKMKELFSTPEGLS